MVDVLDRHADVVQSCAAFCNELANRSLRSNRFQKLYMRVAGIKLCNSYALFLYSLNADAFKTERVSIVSQRTFQIRNCNGDVIYSLHKRCDY